MNAQGLEDFSMYLNSFWRITKADEANENPKNIPNDPPMEPIKSAVDKTDISS